MKTILHKLLAAAKHAGNLLLSRIRDFNRALRQKDRSVRTRYTYAALSLGTVVIAYLLVLLNRGASEIATTFSLNTSFSDILTGIIIFFIIGCEFFIRYKVSFSGGSKKREE